MKTIGNFFQIACFSGILCIGFIHLENLFRHLEGSNNKVNPQFIRSPSKEIFLSFKVNNYNNDIVDRVKIQF